MFYKSTGKTWVIPVLLLAIMFIAGQADAQTKIAGEMTMAYAKSDSIVVPDTEGHIALFGEAKGSNTSTGDNVFMEGAETTIVSYGDLVMGSGPNEGYTIFKMGDDMAVVKWGGDVKTIMTEEGTPSTTFSGTFKYIRGAGQFENISGSGTYKGQFTSPTEYTVDWEGEYTLK